MDDEAGAAALLDEHVTIMWPQSAEHVTDHVTEIYEQVANHVPNSCHAVMEDVQGKGR